MFKAIVPFGLPGGQAIPASAAQATGYPELSNPGQIKDSGNLDRAAGANIRRSLSQGPLYFISCYHNWHDEDRWPSSSLK